MLCKFLPSFYRLTLTFADEKKNFEECSKEYQNYLVDRGYHPSKVKAQFHKAKDTPREDLNRVEHQMSDFEFIVIEKVVNESEDHIDRLLLTREPFW